MAVTSCVTNDAITFITVDQIVCKVVRITINYTFEDLRQSNRWLPLATFKTISTLNDRRFAVQITQNSFVFIDEKRHFLQNNYNKTIMFSLRNPLNKK